MVTIYTPENGPRGLLTLTDDSIQVRGYMIGRGSPEGVITADPGATWMDWETATLWIKGVTTSPGNTGWISGSGPGDNPVFDTVGITSAGTVTAPSLYLGATNTGLYAPAANQIAITAGGVQALKATSTVVTIPNALTVTTGPATFPSGAAPTPSIAVGSSNTGIYSPSTHALALVTNGVDALTITSTGSVILTDPLLLPVGSVSLPSLALGSPDSGLYSTGGNTVEVSATGVQAAVFSAVGVSLKQPTIVYGTLSGTSTANFGTTSPPFATVAVGLSTSGLYSSGGFQVGLVAAGTVCFTATNAAVTLPGSLDVAAGPVTIPAGTAGAPSLAVGGATTGVYSSAANTLDFTSGGVHSINITNAKITFILPTESAGTLYPAANAATPSVAVGDADTGVYSAGSHTLGLAAGGTSVLTAITTGVTIPGTLTVTTGPVSIPAGTVGAPSLALGDADTGLYSTGHGVVNVAADGVIAATFTSALTTIPTALTVTTGPVTVAAGTVGAPSIAVGGSTTGVYSTGAGSVNLAGSGVLAASFAVAASSIVGLLTVPAGTLGGAGLALGDADTGLYSTGAGTVAVTCNGTAGGVFTATTALVPGSLTVTAGPIFTAAGTLGAPSLSLGDTDTGLYSTGHGVVCVSCDGTAGAIITGTTALFPGAVTNTTSTITPLVSQVSPQGAIGNITVIEASASLSGASTTITLAPAGSIMRGIVIRVLTTVTGVALTGINLGDGVAPTLYGSNVNPAATTTTTGANFLVPYRYPLASSGDLVLIPQGAAAFTGGSVRATAYYETMTGPTA